jgi:hypothetical protein
MQSILVYGKYYSIKIWLRNVHFRFTKVLIVFLHYQCPSKMEMHVPQLNFDTSIFFTYYHEFH